MSSDRIDAALCYKRLHDHVVAITAGEPWSLIETLCNCLVRELLAEFPAIERVRVTVHKPEAPIGGTFADVGITMSRCRPGTALSEDSA